MSAGKTPPSPPLSDFGRRLGTGSGIEELMEDLGRALNSGDPSIKMLGGGQPAHIPEANALWRRRLEEIMEDPGALEKMLGNYDPPQGSPAFLGRLRRPPPRALRLAPDPKEHRHHRRRANRLLSPLQRPGRTPPRRLPERNPPPPPPRIHRLRQPRRPARHLPRRQAPPRDHRRARLQIPRRFRRPGSHPGNRRPLRLPPHQPERKRPHRPRGRPPPRAF